LTRKKLFPAQLKWIQETRNSKLFYTHLMIFSYNVLIKHNQNFIETQ